MSLSDNERNKRKAARKRAATWILLLPAIAAGLITMATYSSDKGKASFAAQAASEHLSGGAVQVALVVFMVIYAIGVVALLALYLVVHYGRRRPEPATASSGRRRRRTGYYPSGR